MHWLERTLLWGLLVFALIWLYAMDDLVMVLTDSNLKVWEVLKRMYLPI